MVTDRNPFGFYSGRVKKYEGCKQRHQRIWGLRNPSYYYSQPIMAVQATTNEKQEPQTDGIKYILCIMYM